MSAVRIGELTVNGLRGCPRPFSLSLRGKSLCLLGENGHGKTTLADAMELWSTGDLAAFHREGCSLDAAIHLDAGEAVVELKGNGVSPQRRAITRAGASDLELVGPGAAPSSEPHPIPILRHATIAGFMGQSAGEKKKALLELLGLDALNGLRAPLKTSCGHAKRDAESALRQLAAERELVNSQLAGEKLVAYAELRRVRAGLEQPIREPGDIIALSLARPPANDPDRTGIVDRLTTALAALGDDSSPRWNREITNEETVRADGTAALLESAKRVVLPEDDRCPVCEQPIVGHELAQRLAQRATALEAIRGRLAQAGEDMRGFDEELGALVDVLVTVRRNAPSAGWPDEGQLAVAEDALNEHRCALQAAMRERQAVPAAPNLDPLRSVLPKLRAAATPDSGDSRVRALVELTELRQKCIRLDSAQRRRTVVVQADAAAQRILTIVDEEIERAVTTAIEDIAALVADYYGRLIRGGPFTDVELVYKPARSGQVEFSLTFDGRHREVSPPQRAMSTSQLNALGLAMHLSRLKLSSQPWRVLVLDDVVNSFDASHRQGLARLLADEFSDWQVIVLTHDRVFREVLRRGMTGWEFKEIVAFSARGGPELSDADPRVRLRERLDNGATAMEVAHLARLALEQGLSRPLAKLGYEIRFDPEQRYGARDYLMALRRGFKHNGSPLNDLAVLSRMEADSYMSNFGVHDRLDASALTTDDFYRLADDLDELDSELHCANCDEPAWKQQRNEGGRNRFRCGCGAIAA